MSNVSNIKLFLNKGTTKAKAGGYFTVGGIVEVKFSVIEGSKGLFISLPRSSYVDKQTSETKWVDEVKFANKEVSAQVQAELLAAYKTVLAGGSVGTPKNTSTSAPSTGSKSAPTDNTPF